METWKKSWQIASEQQWTRQDGKEAIVRLQNRTPIKISKDNIWEEDQGQAGPNHADQELEVLVDYSSGEWNKEAESIELVEEESGDFGDLGPVEDGEESKTLNNVENIISSDNKKVCDLDGIESIVLVEEENGDLGDLRPKEGGEESKTLNNVENIFSSDNGKVCDLDGVGIIIESEDILSDDENSVVMGDAEEICDFKS